MNPHRRSRLLGRELLRLRAEKLVAVARRKRIALEPLGVHVRRRCRPAHARRQVHRKHFHPRPGWLPAWVHRRIANYLLEARLPHGTAAAQSAQGAILRRHRVLHRRGRVAGRRLVPVAVDGRRRDFAARKRVLRFLAGERVAAGGREADDQAHVHLLAFNRPPRQPDAVGTAQRVLAVMGLKLLRPDHELAIGPQVRGITVRLRIGVDFHGAFHLERLLFIRAVEHQPAAEAPHG